MGLCGDNGVPHRKWLCGHIAFKRKAVYITSHWIVNLAPKILARHPLRTHYEVKECYEIIVRIKTVLFTGGSRLPNWWATLPCLPLPYSTLSFLFPSPFFSFPLEVGPLSIARGSGPAGSGTEPQRKSNLVHSALKSDLWWHRFY